MIIFHGEGTVYAKEAPKYHPGVVVEFNANAYMNDNLFLKYIQPYRIPALGNRPSLFAMDLYTSYKTSAVVQTLRQHKIVSTLMLACCTSLVQPLDVSINTPLKARIRDLTDEALLDCESVEDFEKWSVGERGILTTWCVGDAWFQFCVEKKDIIQKVFRKGGLSLPIDCSADCELDIKVFTGLSIGDWRRMEDTRSRVNTGLALDTDFCTSLGENLNQQDLWYVDVSTKHVNCSSVEFVADGE